MSHTSKYPDNGCQLAPDVLRRIEELARSLNVDASVFVREAVERYAAGRAPAPSTASETLLERAERAGLVGCLANAHADLSTNPVHFEGFGRD